MSGSPLRRVAVAGAVATAVLLGGTSTASADPGHEAALALAKACGGTLGLITPLTVSAAQGVENAVPGATTENVGDTVVGAAGAAQGSTNANCMTVVHFLENTLTKG